MRRLFFGALLFALASMVSVPTMASAGVNVNVSVALPPIVFAAPPELIVLPETYVYVVPDIDEDIFFYNGWWWRLWEGRWYRSRYYDSGWGYYQRVPAFYAGIPLGWRNDYREHRWGGHQWDYQRIPHQQLKSNWGNWQKNRHWEKQQTWGVQGLQPRAKATQSSQTVKPKPQARESAVPKQSRPQSGVVQQQHVTPQSQALQPKPQMKPQVHEAAKPQPHSGEVQQHAQPQHREAPKQSNPANPEHGKPEKGDDERHDRK